MAFPAWTGPALLATPSLWLGIHPTMCLLCRPVEPQRENLEGADSAPETTHIGKRGTRNITLVEVQYRHVGGGSPVPTLMRLPLRAPTTVPLWTPLGL